MNNLALKAWFWTNPRIRSTINDINDIRMENSVDFGEEDKTFLETFISAGLAPVGEKETAFMGNCV